MIFKPTKNGGRIATGGTRYGDYRVEFPADYDGPVYDDKGREIGRVMMAIKNPAPTKSTIGDRYRDALHYRLGGVSCGACNAEQSRLNSLTADEARHEREAIIEATVARAKALPRWRDRIRAKIGDAVAPEYLRRIIGECFDQAINPKEQSDGN